MNQPPGAQHVISGKDGERLTLSEEARPIFVPESVKSISQLPNIAGLQTFLKPVWLTGDSNVEREALRQFVARAIHSLDDLRQAYDKSYLSTDHFTHILLNDIVARSTYQEVYAQLNESNRARFGNNRVFDGVIATRDAPVEIHPEDDKQSRAIMEKIRAEGIRDEDAVRGIVDGCTFSSEATRRHIAHQIITLLRQGTFDETNPPMRQLTAVNTDAVS